MVVSPVNPPEIKFTRHFIDNEWVDSQDGRTFEVLDPATEKVIANVAWGGAPDVDAATSAAKVAFKRGSKWRCMDHSARGGLLNKLADLIERDREYLAQLESYDNGKSAAVALAADVAMTIKFYRYYAGWADKLHGKVIPSGGNTFSFTRREPVGIVGAIIPWNFPLLMQAWKLAPALCCGNVIILKPAEQTPLSALYVASLVKEAGFPPGVLNIITGAGDTGAIITAHPDIDKIAFTGSTEVGRLVMKSAAVSNIKNITLELGGKSPVIVCEDANLDTAVDAAVHALFFNHGQCCAAGSRTLVHEAIYDRFLEKAIPKVRAIKLGPGLEPGNQQGPQVDKDQFNKIMHYIDSGIREGATLRTGGKRHGSVGYFIQPTVFSEVQDSMKIAQEEIFGPVMQVMKFKTYDEAIERANNTVFGLAAGVFTENVERALTISGALRVGTVWVNGYSCYDAALPFGGYRESGIGREKGEEGLDQYSETKTVVVHLSQKV